MIGSKKVEESYRKAMTEAKIYHERHTFEKAMAKDRDNGNRNLKPPPYVKLKVKSSHTFTAILLPLVHIIIIKKKPRGKQVNKPVGNVKMPEGDSMVACYCKPDHPNPCTAESDCINRVLMIECAPDVCPAGSKCQNQRFVQRNYPAMKPMYTDERGWGLKALELIGEGQFVIEYVGEVIDEAEYRLRLQQKQERKNEHYYFLTIDQNRMIDAEPKGNLSRFMSECCFYY